MSDAVLELWLRLLALHLPESDDETTLRIRNQWLLASRGYFTGCVPHGMEDACATPERRTAVRTAIDSLLAALQPGTQPLDPHTLNLLGIENGWFTVPIERQKLLDVGNAFLDLMDGKIRGDASSAEVMPGTWPYHRSDTND